MTGRNKWPPPMKSECRVYANQHGKWIEFSGGLAEQIAVVCEALGITPKEFVDRALTHYLESRDESPE